MAMRAIPIIRAINSIPQRTTSLYSVTRQVCSKTTHSTESGDNASSSSHRENTESKISSHGFVDWGDEEGANFTGEDWERFRIKEGLSTFDETDFKEWEKHLEIKDVSENVFEDAFGPENLSRKPISHRISFEFEGSMDAIANFDPTITESDIRKVEEMGFKRPSYNEELKPEQNLFDKKTADVNMVNEKPPSPSPTLISDLPRSKRARKQILGEKARRGSTSSQKRAPSAQIDLDFDLPPDPKKEKYENRVAGLQAMFSSLIEDVLSRKPEWSRIDCEIQRILLSPNRRNLTIYYSTEHKPDPQTRKALKLWWKNTISDIKREISSQMTIKYIPNVFAEISKVKESNIDELFDQIQRERSTTQC